MTASVDPSTLTINTGNDAQGTFVFSDLQWNGNAFSGNAYNSLTQENGCVSGTEIFGSINATVILQGQTTSIYTPPPPAMQAELNAMNNLTLNNF